MAFTLYLDDSGTSKGPPVACAAAIIIPAKRIIQLEKEWENLKEKEGFSDFHTSEFVARNHKSEFAGWDDPKHERVFRRVLEITKKFVVQAFAFSVDKDDYDQVIAPGTEFREFSGKEHYTWALRSVIQFAQQWRLEKQVDEPHEWVFDWMEHKSKGRAEVEEVMEQAEVMASFNRKAKGDYRNVDFRPRKELAGLQCADLIAWTNFQMAWENLRGRPSLPLAKIAWNEFEAKRGEPQNWCNGCTDWNMSVVIQKKHLSKWKKDEERDGVALRRFRDWKSGNPISE